jgi:hypothetical protein
MPRWDTAALATRFTRYAEARDRGLLPIDAGRELGLSDGQTRRCERWYREQRSLPPRPFLHDWYPLGRGQ